MKIIPNKNNKPTKRTVLFDFAKVQVKNDPERRKIRYKKILQAKNKLYLI